jgi:hypothetical protein
MNKPSPSPEDLAEAEAFVAATFDPDPPSLHWAEMNRAKAVRHIAVAVMQKRQHAEFHAALAKARESSERVRHIVETELPEIRAELRKLVA